MAHARLPLQSPQNVPCSRANEHKTALHVDLLLLFPASPFHFYWPKSWEQEVAPRHGPGTEKHTYKVPKAPSRRTRTPAREPRKERTRDA